MHNAKMIKINIDSANDVVSNLTTRSAFHEGVLGHNLTYV